MSGNTVSTFRSQLPAMLPEIKKALPSHVTIERFERILLTAFGNSKDLQECSPQSVWAAAMKCAQDGLLPDGREAALVSFKGAAQYLPMVGGILKKIRQSGELKMIAAHVVYANDKFDYEVTHKGETFNHSPEIDGDRGAFRLCYAMAETKDGGFYFELLTKQDVEKIRSVSRAQGAEAPWAKWYDEKAKVAAIKRLSKRLPMSTDLAWNDHEEESEADAQVTVASASPAPVSRLHGLLTPEESDADIKPATLLDPAEAGAASQ